MSRRTRLGLAGCAALFALAGPASALAAYVPRLSVGHAAGASTITIQVPRDDDATARVQFYAPLPYQATLGQAAGTQLGTVAATVQAKAISPDAILPLTGAVRADDPTRHVANPCSPGAHAAVWVMALEAAGRTLMVPIYVDPVTAGPEAAFARLRMIVCLPPPDVPESQGGAAFGAKLLTAALTLRGVFTAPTSGQHVWPGIFTPYVAGGGQVNAPGTVEARAVVRVPSVLTLNGRITNRRRRILLLSGALTEGGTGIPGATVTISAGRQSFRTRTGANGRYSTSLVRRGPRRAVTTTFRARSVVPARDATSIGCGGQSLAPRGCVSATIAGFTAVSRAIRIRL
jgi:hypothetical protein